MYTTNEAVRAMSGLDDEVNISDSNINNKIKMAVGLVNSALSTKYTLPISYRYKNTITFGGLGTGAGTMAVVINGTTYNVDIASGDTGDTVADKFRLATMNSTDFVSDGLGTGEVSVIVSKTDSSNTTTAYAEVNVTSAPNTLGITATIGTRITTYPSVLEEVTTQIATALLLIDIYGVESQDSGKDGENRMDRVYELLKMLQGVEEPMLQIIDDVTQEEITQSTVGGADSYPNDISDVDIDDPTSPQAYMNKVF